MKRASSSWLCLSCLRPAHSRTRCVPPISNCGKPPQGLSPVMESAGSGRGPAFRTLCRTSHKLRQRRRTARFDGQQRLCRTLDREMRGGLTGGTIQIAGQSLLFEAAMTIAMRRRGD